MFRPQSGYSGFSVDDVPAATSFYRDVLRLETEVIVDGQMFRLRLTGGAAWVFVHGRPDHVAASDTVLDFVVVDDDDALDGLAELGLESQHLGGHSDERGVMRGRSLGWAPTSPGSGNRPATSSPCSSPDPLDPTRAPRRRGAGTGGGLARHRVAGQPHACLRSSRLVGLVARHRADRST